MLGVFCIADDHVVVVGDGAVVVNVDFPVDVEARNDWVSCAMSNVWDGLPKKVAVLLDFVQITSTPIPPPPNLDNLCHFCLTPMCQKILAGVSPSLPIPKLTHYIQFVKS